MKRKMMLFGVVLILGLLALGCSNDGGGPSGPDVVAIWENADATLTFYSDDTFEYVGEETINGTYTINGNTVTLTESNGEPAGTGTVDGNTMTIGSDVFTKQSGNGDDIVLNGTWWVRMGKDVEQIIDFTSAKDFKFTGRNVGAGGVGTYIVSGSSFTASPTGYPKMSGNVSGNRMTIDGDTYIKLAGTSWNLNSKTITFTTNSAFTLTDGNTTTPGTYRYDGYDVKIHLTGESEQIVGFNKDPIRMIIGEDSFTLR